MRHNVIELISIKIYEHVFAYMVSDVLSQSFYFRAEWSLDTDRSMSCPRTRASWALTLV